jgi:uncharacterized protein YodC (DUF2158 family)
VEQFKVGDTVRLKSGGPVMTITDIDEYSGFSGKSANCKWFVNSGVKEDVFPLDTIEVAAAPDPPR